MTRQQKRKIMKAVAAGVVVLAGTACLARKDRRKAAKELSPRKAKAAGKHETAAKIAVVASFGALMYVKSRIIPKYADDYAYSFKWNEEYGNLVEGEQEYERVKTLKDLVQSQIAHYKTWDGRVLADFVVQLVLMSDDKKPFDRANTLVMLSQLLVCAAMGKGTVKELTKKLTVSDTALLTAGFWIGAPALIATCFWLTGSITYLWTGLAETLYVLPYALHYHNPAFSLPIPLAAVMGLVAGWSVETGAGAALMSSSLELFRSIRKKEAAPWMFAGVMGTVAGMALLLGAPGNRLKFTLERERSDTLPKSMDDRLPGYIPPEYNYTPTMFRLWLKEGFLPTILRELPLQIPVILYFCRKECRSREATEYILGLEATALAIPSVLMLSPEYPKRAPYHSILYLLPASLKAWDMLGSPSFGEWSPLAKKLGVAAAGALLVNFTSSLVVDADLRCQIDDQVETLRKNCKEENIYFDAVGLSSFYSFLAGNRAVTWDVLAGLGFENTDDPYNKAAAAYYGVKNITSRRYEDHRYCGNDRKVLLYQLIDPLKSLVRVVKKFLKRRT